MKAMKSSIEKICQEQIGNFNDDCIGTMGGKWLGTSHNTRIMIMLLFTFGRRTNGFAEHHIGYIGRYRSTSQRGGSTQDTRSKSPGYSTHVHPPVCLGAAYSVLHRISLHQDAAGTAGYSTPDLAHTVGSVYHGSCHHLIHCLETAQDYAHQPIGSDQERVSVKKLDVFRVKKTILH